MNETRVRQCTRCVMDETAVDIDFDAKGVCNYCRQFLERQSHIVFSEEGERRKHREWLISEVKKTGKGKLYDCVVGLSGGVDSAWTLYEVVNLGLRPLVVHMDNGWNTELAQSNIENLVRKLNVDLYVHVIDWGEYRDLMRAFFQADVIDIELLYDQAMKAVNYQQAAKYGIRYILSGENKATEGMHMPPRWNWFKNDKKNIKNIYKKFGSGLKISTFPFYGTFEHLYYTYLKRITWCPFLDCVDYKKDEALKILQKELGYKPYPYKHYESVFTRFYQGFLLPEKFGVDKRKLHLSNLIMSKQISRKDAVQMLSQSPYPEISQLESDKKYFLKKIGWSPDDLNKYLSKKCIEHDFYGSEKDFFNRCNKLAKSFFRLIRQA
ncbi:MAG: N-acetyl sugar amidotransferase [Candidatus Electrothrix sp. AR5]|nr:N-acetyl sugar amidotransferase [Candidatus Electrothrix sp. AR5]